jgi:hypothetical protein
MHVVLLLSACLLVAPRAPAAAASPRAMPPNNSAIDEFLTTTPGPSGDERLPRGEEPVPSPLTQRQRRRLHALGPEGDRTITLLGETAPAAASPAAGRRPADANRPPESRGAAGEVVAAVAGKGRDGLGLVLPGILIAALVGALAAVVRRRTPAARAHEGPEAGVSNTR